MENQVTREIELDAAPDEGWVEEYEPGRRLSIWWSDGDEDAARVQFDLEEALGGTRLVVTETWPLAALELEFPGGPVMLAHA